MRRPGVEPGPRAWEARILTTRLTALFLFRHFSLRVFLFIKLKYGYFCLQNMSVKLPSKYRAEIPVASEHVRLNFEPVNGDSGLFHLVVASEGNPSKIARELMAKIEGDNPSWDFKLRVHDYGLVQDTKFQYELYSFRASGVNVGAIQSSAEEFGLPFTVDSRLVINSGSRDSLGAVVAKIYKRE